jgi:hypothetical protein
MAVGVNLESIVGNVETNVWILNMFASVWMMQQATPQISSTSMAFGVAIVNHALEVVFRMRLVKARPKP